MKLDQLIANRMMSRKRGSLSGPFVRIATVAVALSLTVMIIAVAIVTGFKYEISAKTIGFGSHIQIVNHDTNISFETHPISSDQEFLPELKGIEGVEHVQVFALKPGILKTAGDIEGIVVKGIGPDFDWSFFGQNLTEGQLFQPSGPTESPYALISRHTARRLRLSTGDHFDVFFVQEPPRIRRFTVAGVYDTQMAEFDKLFVLADIRHIQRLNGWAPDQVTGFEVQIDNFRNLDAIRYQVENLVAFNLMSDGSMLRVMSIVDRHPQIFDWLNLQDMNVIILLTLMLVVAGINMISGLLIIILEQTSMIGVLKTLGAGDGLVRRIFLIQSGHIIARGLLWGNLFGIGLCLIQLHFGLITLDPYSYYLSQVPINLSAAHVLMLNLGTFVVTFAMLVGPSMVISRISPDKIVKFE